MENNDYKMVNKMLEVLQEDFDELLKLKGCNDWDLILGGHRLGEFDAVRKFVERVTGRYIAITDDHKIELTSIKIRKDGDV